MAYDVCPGNIKIVIKWLKYYLLFWPLGVEKGFTSEENVSSSKTGPCAYISCGKQLSWKGKSHSILQT